MMLKLAVLAVLGASVASVSASTITLYGRQTTIGPSVASISSPPLTATGPAFTSTTTIRDPWQCATQNLSQYFDVPKPSGTLSVAIDAYVDELVEPCLETATGTDLLNCRVTDSSRLCGFTSFVSATPALITAFASYGNEAASFWRSNSKSVSSLSVECASAWKHFGELNHAWLNQTIVYASCVLDDLPPISTTASSVSPTSSGTGVAGTTRSTTNTAGLA